MDHAVPITLADLIASGEPVVALFGARWAPASSVLTRAAEEAVTVVGCAYRYVDCDDDAATADHRQVINLPTAVAYASGRELDRTRGGFGVTELTRLARTARSYADRHQRTTRTPAPAGGLEEDRA